MSLGSQWLDAVEASGCFSIHALKRGSEYARYDWQLEADVEPGVASITARSGRRMSYRASAHVPCVSPAVWDGLISKVAGSTEATAALLDRELPDGVAEGLLPDAAEIRLECTCQSNDQPCKHAAALLPLIAEVIDEDPFELLHLRGMSRHELVDRVTARRRGPEIEPGDSASDTDPQAHASTDSSESSVSDGLEGALHWSEQTTSAPPDSPIPAMPGSLTPFATEPPASAGFTASGLRTLANDAAHRALDFLRDGTAETHRIHATADLARRAALEIGTGGWRHLVRQSGVSSQELTARAKAWEVAGVVGVDAQVAPLEVKRMTDRATGAPVQWRRTGDNSWVRFEKISGRWEAAAGPVSSPDTEAYVDSADDIESGPDRS